MTLVDTHCHLAPTPRRKPEQGAASPLSAQELLARARQKGVAGFVVVGVGQSTEEAQGAVALAKSEPDVVAVVGVHPHDAQHHTELMFEELSALGRQEEVVAIGEIGLDFHYDHSPRDIQREVFARYVELAKSLEKPIVIHTRSAGQECLELLESLGARSVSGVIHCFSEDEAFARRALDLGFDLSFSGIVTFKTAKAIQAVASLVPRDRYVVETDAPYLAPVPYRGKKCEPAMVIETAKMLAALRNCDVRQIEEETTANALRRFPRLAGRLGSGKPGESITPAQP